MDKKIVGVIGGMGPIATSHYMELIIRMTEAKTDQEHLDMIIYNIPSIPDRTDFILHPEKPSPLPGIIQIGHKLEEAGAEYLCMPCITAHCFSQELKKQFQKPLIHIVEETAAYLADRQIKQVGIMATDGTIHAGLFQQELSAHGITPLVPDERSQKDVMHLIYHDVKADEPADMKRFFSVAEGLKEQGAEAIILGCTELSLIKRDEKIGPGFLDAMEVLSMRTVELCGCKVKPEYRELITK